MDESAANKDYALEMYYGLEEHLKSFRNIPLYEKLCCSWEVDKQTYIKSLSANDLRSPHFSDHGEEHSKKIISGIEFILGKKRIKQLSVSDTWLLLQCAYAHDLGMGISAKELVEKMSSDKEFYLKIKETCEKDDAAREALEFIQPLIEYHLSEKKDGLCQSKYKEQTTIAQRLDTKTQYEIFETYDITQWPLKLINAFSILLENYVRPQHGMLSKEILEKTPSELCENGIIPSRMRYLVARISAMHTENRERIMDLPQEALGLCNDYLHPRFAAIMLRLGDLLDIDNGRFNQAQLNVFGEMPQASMLHQFKHEAITHFLVTPLEISVKADFRSETAEKILKNNSSALSGLSIKRFCMKSCQILNQWLQMLKAELEFLSVHWLDIVPRKFEGSCPLFSVPELCIDGKRVYERELNLQYEISTKRSAEIIEGSSLYNRPQFTFLREVLQNALDATKMQMYEDVITGLYSEFYDDDGKIQIALIEKLTPICFLERMGENLEHYRIEYTIQQDSENKKGIQISIRDYGVGITYDDLKNMLRIGQSSKETIHDIENMPTWLKPTGSFGIGLQSVFYVAPSFIIKSRPRFEKEHATPPLREMVFYSTRMGGEIEVSICDSEEAKNFGYGTEVIIHIQFNEDQDKQLMYINQVQQNDRDTFFDVFCDDFSQIINEYKGYIKNIYNDFIICREKKPHNPPKRKSLCEQNNTEINKYLPTRVATVFEGFFGRLCLLLDSRIIKDGDDNSRFSFSCWSLRHKMLIRYTLIDSVEDLKAKAEIFYKGIKIEDTNLDSLVLIPFFHVQIFLFEENANAVLEISRDKLLPEKEQAIINSVYSVHYDFLKALFEMKLFERLFSTDCYTEEERDNRGNKNKDKVEAEARLLHILIKWYLLVLMNTVLPDTQSQLLIQEDIDHAMKTCQYDMIDHELFAYYEVRRLFLHRYAIYSISDLASFYRFVFESGSDVWFSNYQMLPRCDMDLNWNGFDREASSVYIIKDFFYYYLQFAATEFKVVMIRGWSEPMMIYKLGARTGELVTSDQENYWKLCVSLYKNAAQNITAKDSYRLVFPSNNQFAKISVTELIDGIRHREIRKLNSYIISPFAMEKLEQIVSKCENKQQQIEKVLDEEFSDAIEEAEGEKNDNWLERHRYLIKHIQKYTVKLDYQEKGKSAITDCDIYQSYKSFLIQFLQHLIADAN